MDVMNTINSELMNIREWGVLNKLTLSVAKTRYTIFHRNKEMPLTLPDVTLAGVPLKSCLCEVLGIHADFQLGWKSHFANTRGKLNKQRGLMKYESFLT